MGLLSGIIGGAMMGMFQSLGINRFEGQAKAELTIQALGRSGNPLKIYGVDTLRLRNNPEILDLPEMKADYAEHRAIGMVRPVLHYTGSDIGQIPLDFIMTDDVDGPPHAFRDSNGNMVYTDFQDLYAVQQWLRALTQPLKEAEQPPLVKVSWGPWSEVGVIVKLASRVVRMYPTGFPKIMEISMDLRPEPVFTDSDREMFRVK